MANVKQTKKPINLWYMEREENPHRDSSLLLMVRIKVGPLSLAEAVLEEEEEESNMRARSRSSSSLAFWPSACAADADEEAEEEEEGFEEDEEEDDDDDDEGVAEGPNADAVEVEEAPLAPCAPATAVAADTAFDAALDSEVLSHDPAPARSQPFLPCEFASDVVTGNKPLPRCCRCCFFHMRRRRKREEKGGERRERETDRQTDRERERENETEKRGYAIEGGAPTVARCAFAGGTCQICKLKRKPAPV